MSPRIHPLAVVEKGAVIEDDVTIEPFAYIGKNVHLHSGVYVGSSVRIDGYTEVGEGTKIFHGAAIGLPPQDVAYKGERSFVRIGKNNTIREFVTIHSATGEDQETVIGDNNYLMAYSHFAHNVRVGNNVIVVNAAQLAGFVEVGDHAFISGLVAIHQFSRVGAYAIVGGLTKVVKDIPPFFMAVGNPARIVGLNIVGLRRKKFSSERVKIIKQAYKILYRSGLSLSNAVEKIRAELPLNDDIKLLLEFIENSKRGITLKSGTDREGIF